MKSLSVLKKFLLFLPMLVLASCATPVLEEDVLVALATEGILSPFDPHNIQAMQFDLTQAHVGDLIQTFELPVTVVYPRSFMAAFEAETIGQQNAWITSEAWEYGHFSGTTWRVGDRVNEGDFIAELYYIPPESIVIDRHSLALEREQFEINFEQEQNRRLQEISDLEHQLTRTNEWQMLALRLEHAELSYSQFLINSNNRREYFDERLDDINERIENERLYSPINGRVTFATQHTAPGLFRDVPSLSFGGNIIGRRVITIVDDSYLHFMADLPMRAGETAPIFYALRYGEILTVEVVGVQGVQDRLGLSLRFDAMVATDAVTTRENTPVRLVPVCEDEFAFFLEEIEEMNAIDDRTDFLSTANLRVRPVVPLALSATIVDSRAVIEENHRHFVMLYEDGQIGKRYVSLGSVLDIRTQIISGLEPGQWVVMP